MLFFKSSCTSKWISLVVIHTLLLHFQVVSIEKVDTTKLYSIDEITVTEHYRNSEIRSTAPFQILSAKQLKNLNALQLSDALKFFSGVNVKDYGGIGGLKTISVRSLGANHTAVSYDGITLTDGQTGQIDIGKFSLNNIDFISLNNGQADNIFQPARLFASASVLNIRTLAPKFDNKKNCNGFFSTKLGSFGLFSSSLLVQNKINKTFSSSLSAEYLQANGEYPYVFYYGNVNTGLQTLQRRKNSDIRNLKLEGTVYANFSENESAYLKAYFYNSERGLPGATIFYNQNAFTSQRLNDQTFFVQGHWQKYISRSLNLQANTKYNYGYVHYLDTNVLNTVGKTESVFRQKEYYASFSALYRAFNHLSISFSITVNFLFFNRKTVVLAHLIIFTLQEKHIFR